MLSPRGNSRPDQDSEVGASFGTKRRLDSELQQRETISVASSIANQVFTHEFTKDGQHTHASQHQNFVSETFESKMKRVKNDGAAAGFGNKHSSAFDLVDDALHISSDDEFPELDIPLLPSSTRTSKI